MFILFLSANLLIFYIFPYVNSILFAYCDLKSSFASYKTFIDVSFLDLKRTFIAKTDDISYVPSLDIFFDSCLCTNDVIAAVNALDYFYEVSNFK